MKRKNLLSLVLSLAMIASCTTVHAAENNHTPDTSTNTSAVYMDANGKVAFAAEKDALFANTPQTCAFASEEKRFDVINNLMYEAAFSADQELDSTLLELESLGVYQYNSPTDNTPIPASASSDVELKRPSIYYDAYSAYWYVTCSGSWITDAWKTEGVPGNNVGGYDGFGVCYYNTSGTYNTLVTGTTAFLNNGLSGDDYKSVITANRSDGDGRVGFGFRLQDRIEFTQETPDAVSYLGERWYGCCSYDSNFSYYNGIATSYYIHTWKQASLTSVTFSFNADSPSISYTVGIESQSFPAFSTDTAF